MKRFFFQLVFVLAAAAALTTISHGQQPAPRTGGPRQLWPQRPGPARVLDLAPRPLPPATAVQDQRVVQPEPEYVPNEVLVQFDEGVSELERTAARSAVGVVRQRTLRGGGGRLERLSTTLAVPDAVAILQQLPQVEFAEPNWIVRHYATSNDTYYTSGQLWGMYGDATTPANVYGSGAGELWAQDHTGSSEVYVAVIDEGIDFNHPDLAPNMWTNPFDPVDGTDNDENGKIDDVHGWDFFEDDNSIYDGPPGDTDTDSHGTHVAGTIGARGGNGIGVAGVNWNVTIIGTKFLGPVNGSTADAVEALDYIIDLKVRHGLNIVATNNSWGGGGASQALHQAIIRAAKQDILFIAAAGNAGSNNDATPHYPSNYSTLVAAGSETAASYEAVISVASIASSGARSGFSNFGATSVDVGAPGSGVVSTTPQNTYGNFSGTSMATPHVAGAAALYKSINPAASAAEIRDAILSRVVPTASLAGITVTGGRLDVGAFVAMTPPPALDISDAIVSEGDAGTTPALFTVSLSAPAAAAVTVNYTTSDVTALGGAVASGSAITIPEWGSAALYPSTLAFPAVSGTVTGARVVLRGFSHQWPDDVDVLMVGPAGQTVVLMSDVGGTADAVNVTLTFDDTGTEMPDSSALSSGVYRPANPEPGNDGFPGPAPSGPYGSSLSVFNGTDPEGTWRLFIADDTGDFGGSLSGGWSLYLSTTSGLDYVANAGVVTIPAGATSAALPIAVVGDTVLEGDETFHVTLSSPIGAVLADAVAVGTIQNDDLFGEILTSGLHIRAVHIAELRAAINAARAARGLALFSFTDPSLVAGMSPIRAIHLIELRAALDEVYDDAGASRPVYTDPTIVPGVTPARAAHLTELRAAVLAAP